MSKKINAKQLAGDIRSGMGNAAIMKKYQLTPQAYQTFVKKMIAAGVITREEVQQRGKKKPAKKTPAQPAKQKPPPKKRPEATPPPVPDEEEPAMTMKTCGQCGYQALAWKDKCPNCGMGENDVDHVLSYDPVSVIFRFFATAIFFGFPVLVVYRYTLRFITGMPLFIWIGIPLVWGVLGIFYYEKITTLSRNLYEKWAANKVLVAVCILVIFAGMILFNHFAFQLGFVDDGGGSGFEEELSKFPLGSGAETPSEALENYVSAVLVNNNATEAIDLVSRQGKEGICENFRFYWEAGMLEEDPVLTDEDFDLPDEELILRLMESLTSPENPHTPVIEDETFEILKETKIGKDVLYLYQIDEFQGSASAVKEGDKWYVAYCPFF